MKYLQTLLDALNCLVDVAVIFIVYGSIGGAAIQGLALLLGIQLTEVGVFRLAAFFLCVVFWEWHRGPAKRFLHQLGGGR